MEQNNLEMINDWYFLNIIQNHMNVFYLIVMIWVEVYKARGCGRWCKLVPKHRPKMQFITSTRWHVGYHRDTLQLFKNHTDGVSDRASTRSLNHTQEIPTLYTFRQVNTGNIQRKTQRKLRLSPYPKYECYLRWGFLCLKIDFYAFGNVESYTNFAVDISESRCL